MAGTECTLALTELSPQVEAARCILVNEGGAETVLKQIVIAAAFLSSTSATAQDGWTYRTTLYGWLAGLSSTVETPQGDLETDIDFDEVLEDLNLGVFGAFDARNGRFSLLADAMFLDLTSELAGPFGGAVYSRGEVDTKMVLVNALAMYALVDDASVRFEVGGGLRYSDMDIDTRLTGQDAVPDVAIDSDADWADLLISTRISGQFTNKWFGVAYADVGGFAIDEASSDLTWQALAGVGYQFTKGWSAVGGYRYLSIEREFLNVDTTTEVYGPFLGAQFSF